MFSSWVLIIAVVFIAKAVSKSGGSQLPRRQQCKHCGGVYPANANFCGQCGVAFGGRKRRRRALRIAAAVRS